METREDRGRAIAEQMPLQRKGDGPFWVVPSQSRRGKYLVDQREQTCTCPDYEAQQEPCKHIFAVDYTIRRMINGRGETTVTETLRVTYSQDWPAYNAAETHEKERVAVLLRDLCSAIDNPPQKRGRPRLPLSDSVFAAVMKVYGGTSGRRAQTDLREFGAKGLMGRTPAYNSVFKVLENPVVTSILHAMLQESAVPLKTVETDFAVDASGFSTSTFARWYSAKYGREMTRNLWMKAHVMVGTKTNVITSATITDGFCNDGPEYPDLLQSTAQRFNVARVSADKAYSSRINLSETEMIGAQPFIPFKSNVRSDALGLDVWGRMYHFFAFNREEFLQHYHRRSNVETTFSMIKAKFGTKVRSKTPTAQVNEILAKLICHNLCCLVHATYELGIEATFWHSAG